MREGTESKQPRVNVGDVYCIRLPDERYAYIQYIRADSHGPLFRVSNRISRTIRTIKEIGDFSELRMPPVYVMGVLYAIRERGWTKIGKLPFKDYEPPLIKIVAPRSLHSDSGYEFDEVSNGKERFPISPEHRKNLHQMQMNSAFSPDVIEDMILTGYSFERNIPYHPKPNPFVDLDVIAPLIGSEIGKIAPAVSDPDTAEGEDEVDQPSVLIHLDGVNLPNDIYEKYDLMTLEDKLEAKLEKAGFGEVDGNEVGEGGTTVFLYADDAEKLFRAIKPVLRSYPLCRKARVVIFNGKSEREEIIPG